MKPFPSDLVLIISVIGGIMLMMWLVRQIAVRFDLSAESQRKLVHIATGATALGFPFMFSTAGPVLVLVGFSIAVMLLLRNRKWRGSDFSAVLHNVERESYGEIYLALSVAILFVLSQHDFVLYLLPLLIITLSDTAAAIVGSRYGRRRFTVGDVSKSLEGVFAFFAVTWLLAMITLSLNTDDRFLDILVLSTLIAAFSALVEADSWSGLDNLFVPVSAHVFLAQYLNADALDLVVLATLFCVAITVMVASAKPLKISKHTARCVATLVFVIFSATATYNALLPIIAILTHIAAVLFIANGVLA